MADKYIKADAHIEKMSIIYSSFRFIENGKVIKKCTPKGDEIMNKKIKEFNIRPRCNLKNNEAIIKDEKFIKYAENYILVNNNNKKKKKRKNSSLKLKAFIGAATLIAILSVAKLSKEAKAEDLDVTYQTVTEEATTEEIANEPEDDKISVNPEVEIASNTNAESNVIENSSTIVYSDFEDIFQTNVDDLTGSNSNNNRIVEERYGALIDKYSEMYGMDPMLARAIIAFENPSNSINNNEIIDETNQIRLGGYGPGQEESVHNGEKLKCYNHITGETDVIADYAGVDKNGKDMFGVDVKKCETDMDYAIKVMIMQYMSNANYLNDFYNGMFSDAEFLFLCNDAYNKGVYGVEGSIKKSSSFAEIVYHNKQLGGDEYYNDHVSRYVIDGSEITIKTSDGVEHTVIYDNTNVNDYIVDDNNPNIKPMTF